MFVGHNNVPLLLRKYDRLEHQCDPENEHAKNLYIPYQTETGSISCRDQRRPYRVSIPARTVYVLISPVLSYSDTDDSQWTFISGSEILYFE
ncbi:hypothetical protein F2P81_010270 [Scophthalmus maximus]|uniref:Uncharacterized protein n=1 Tax=Scophthalmus maximus TaxID=52904 RepID=A0A6A4SQD6_SCOMX|nr:hypothetical protein F2P81_010270 [Scophthalmus maximus]